jgi:hypothetical protein
MEVSMQRLMIAAVVCLLAACNETPPQKNVAAPEPAAPVTTVAPAPMAVGTGAWIGDWIGVEGNTLKIEATATQGEYAITEGTLDGPRTYSGKAAEGETIVFTDKDQKTRSIRAGTGEDTGLKYLAGKTNCLWIETGRGFCRD